MNDLTVFNYEDNAIRTIQQNGETWFVLRDVCDVLKISKTTDVAKRLDDDEKGVAQIDTLGGVQEMHIVNEYGLYNVILRSDKEDAKKFKRWVTHDVLPTLRKSGAYQIAPTYEKPTMAEVRYMELQARTMEHMNCTPFEVAGMIARTGKAYGLMVSPELASKVDPQLSLFSTTSPALLS